MKAALCFLPILFLFFGLGYVLGSKRVSLPKEITNIIQQDDDKEIRLKEGYTFINPLLECDSGTTNLVSVKKLQQEVQDLVSQNISAKNIVQASVYFRDLNNGPWFGINQDALFSPASLLKVPMMLAYYKLSETDPSLLDRVVKNEGVDYTSAYENVSYTPVSRLEKSKDYTVTELIERMIVDSDNVAYMLLNNTIDNAAKAKIYDDLGVNITAAYSDPAGNIVSIRDYSSFFRILYNASYLNRSLSEKALGVLSRSQFKDGLVAGLPGGTVVSHKFGERFYVATGEKQLHDCGIIYTQPSPYLLCVMTRGNDNQSLSKVISQISSKIYNSVTTTQISSK